jgi:hypothetical protein
MRHIYPLNLHALQSSKQYKSTLELLEKVPKDVLWVICGLIFESAIVWGLPRGTRQD